MAEVGKAIAGPALPSTTIHGLELNVSSQEVCNFLVYPVSTLTSGTFQMTRRTIKYLWANRRHRARL